MNDTNGMKGTRAMRSKSTRGGQANVGRWKIITESGPRGR